MSGSTISKVHEMTPTRQQEHGFWDAFCNPPNLMVEKCEWLFVYILFCFFLLSLSLCTLCTLCRLLCFTPGFKRRLGCVPRFPPKLPHSIGYVEGMPKGSERYTPFWDKPMHGTSYYWLYPHVFCSISPFFSDSLNNIYSHHDCDITVKPQISSYIYI